MRDVLVVVEWIIANVCAAVTQKQLLVLLIDSRQVCAETAAVNVLPIWSLAHELSSLLVDIVCICTIPKHRIEEPHQVSSVLLGVKSRHVELLNLVKRQVSSLLRRQSRIFCPIRWISVLCILCSAVGISLDVEVLSVVNVLDELDILSGRNCCADDA